MQKLFAKLMCCVSDVPYCCAMRRNVCLRVCEKCRVLFGRIACGCSWGPYGVLVKAREMPGNAPKRSGGADAARRMQCLSRRGKCRAAFRRVACCASALSSHRSTITRLSSGTSPSQLHCHLRAVSLVSRHFPPLHGALRSSTAALAALPSHPL